MMTTRHTRQTALSAPSRKGGFTIFFAMLVAALSLSVGLAIYDLTAREIDLSSTATKSQYALYAADTGAECALYWDSKYNGTNSAFGTSTSPGSSWAGGGINCGTVDVTTAPPPTQDQSRYAECSGNPGTAWCISSTASAATTTFGINATAGQPCAVVQVAKRTISNVLYTTVISRGYNTCATGALRIERTLQVNY